MLYSLGELKKDLVINKGGVPYRIVESQHTKMGRGGAIAKTKLKNLLDGSLIAVSFAGQDRVEAASVTKVDMQYLYKDGPKLMLMDLTTYDQIVVPSAIVGDRWQYLPEGSKVIVLQFNGHVIDIELPAKIDLKVTEAASGSRGDTAKAATKLCVLETGAKVSAPLFIKPGDTIRLDTRDGSYLERKKQL